MNSQMGLAQLWAQGDFVTRAVAIVLLLMSLASWTVIVLKALDLARYRKMTAGAQAFTCQSGQVADLILVGQTVSAHGDAVQNGLHLRECEGIALQDTSVPDVVRQQLVHPEASSLDAVRHRVERKQMPVPDEAKGLEQLSSAGFVVHV